MRFKSFDDTVRDICLYLGDLDASKKYIPVSRYLVQVINELNISLFKTIKSTTITVNSNMTADLPNDLITLMKVGVCCEDGRLRLLGQDNKLCMNVVDEGTYNCCDCGESSDDMTVEPKSCCSKCTFHNFTYPSEFADNPFYRGYTALYGYTPKMFRNGRYRMDYEYNRILLSDGYDVEIGGDLIIEYKSSLGDDKYNLIPMELYAVILHRVCQYYYASKQPNQSRNEERLFKIEYKQAKRILNKFTLDDVVAAFRSAYKSSPKR